ncbi:MAG: DUF4403 family protein [Bacteroidota bacterium]
MWNKFLLILLIAVLFACKSIEPIAPVELVKEVPALIQQQSNMALPIELNLAPYFKDIDNSIDKTIRGKEDKCSGVSYSYRFERYPINFEGKGNYLFYEVKGKYALNINYCPECTYLFSGSGNCVIPRVYASCGVKEAMRRATVSYTTKVKLNPDFSLNGTTSLQNFETPDKCEVTFVNYDATDKLRKEVLAVLKDLEKEIDKSIEEVDLKSTVNDVWKMFTAPQSLGNYGLLYIQPKEIALSEIQFVNKKAIFDLNIVFEPLISTNRIDLPEKPLPRLSEYKRGDGFEINLDIKASYDSLSKILNRELRGKEIDIKKNHIVFDSVKIESAAGAKINLAIKFSGSKKGTLYLNGTPNFNAANQIISFPDLNFDIATKNALLKSAKWMFNNKITEAIRQQATFDLKPQLEKIKATIAGQLNKEISPGYLLKGSVNTISINAIFPSADQLYIRTYSKGKLILEL